MTTCVSSNDFGKNAIDAQITSSRAEIAMIQIRFDYVEEKIRKLETKKENSWNRRGNITDPVTKDFGRIYLNDFESLVIKQHIFKKERQRLTSDIKTHQAKIAQLSREL